MTPGFRSTPVPGRWLLNRSKDADKAGAGVWRATNHLHLLHGAFGAIGPGGHTAQAQTIGIGVLHRFDHPANPKCTQLFRRIFNAFNLVAQIGQGVEDVVKRKAPVSR